MHWAPGQVIGVSCLAGPALPEMQHSCMLHSAGLAAITPTHVNSSMHVLACSHSLTNHPPPAPLPAAQRWPALLLKVYHRAVYVGQDAFVGYALCPLPTTPGLHHLTCDVWAVEDTERSFAQQLKGAWCSPGMKAVLARACGLLLCGLWRWAAPRQGLVASYHSRACTPCEQPAC